MGRGVGIGGCGIACAGRGGGVGCAGRGAPGVGVFGILGHLEGGTMTVAPKFGCGCWVGVRACGVIGAPQS